MIKLNLIGRLGKDATQNNVNGKNVINFTVAHSERFKDAQGNQKEKTIWVDCAYWTERTGVFPYLKKGTQVFVDGAPDVRTYQTQDGKQGATLTMRVNSIELLGSKADSGGDNYGGGNQPYGDSNTGYNKVSPPAGKQDTDFEDDLPF